MDESRKDPGQTPAPALDSEDYYFDGPNMVFTETFHLKRGSCCGSGCRHCPYGFAAIQSDEEQASNQGADPPAGEAG